METGQIKTIRGFQEALRELEDSRRGQGRVHTIDMVVMTAMMAVMSGCLGYRAIEDFIERERESLLKYLKPPKGKVPSASTIRRVMTHVDERRFLAMYEQWVGVFHQSLQDELVAIDGKSIRGAMSEEGKLAHIVSLFSHRHKESLSMAQTAAKSNEIPLVREMVNAMKREGLTYTLDAMHCQKETLETILEQQCDYVVGVKQNQKKTT